MSTISAASGSVSHVSADAAERRAQSASSLDQAADKRRDAVQRSQQADEQVERLESGRQNPAVRAELNDARGEAARARSEARRALAEEIVLARTTLSPAMAERYEQDLERELSSDPKALRLLQEVQLQLDPPPPPPQPDYNAALAEIRDAGHPDFQVIELQEQAEAFEAEYGRAAAEELVARYIAANPAAFAEGYNGASYVGAISEDTRALFAAGLDKAFDRISNYRGGQILWARSLLAGAEAEGGPHAFRHLAVLVAESGNDALQTAYVRAALGRVSELATLNDGWIDGQVDGLAGSIGLAAKGSTQAAQAIIRYAETHALGSNNEEMHEAGPAALQWLLERFNQTGAVTGNDQDALLSFLEAAAPAGAAGLGNHESLTLFLAIAGNEQLLADSGQRGIALVSELFMNSLNAWAGDPSLKFVLTSNIAKVAPEGSRYAGWNIGETLTTFFEVALVNPDHDGAHRPELLAFVTQTFFDTFDPNSSISRALDPNGSAEPNPAGQFAGNLLGILQNAQVNLYAQIAQEGEEKKRLYTLLYVTAIAALGGGVGSLATGLIARAAVAGLTELAKTGGRFTIDDLVDAGVDRETARIIEQFVNHRGSIGDAFEASGLGQLLGNVVPNGAAFEAVADTLESSLSSGDTLAQALKAVAGILDDLSTSSALNTLLRKWQEQMETGYEYQTG